MTKRIIIQGLVQGVGFRPFVLANAKKLGVKGTVKNLGAKVEIYASGDGETLKEFEKAIKTDLPQGAEIWNFSSSVVKDAVKQKDFKIAESGEDDDILPLVMPDIGICDYCKKNIATGNSRRKNNPFESCTVCGPRFSIQKKIPYDRENTTMSVYPFCPDCGREFGSLRNPHKCWAQTLCCNNCGPVLKYKTKGEKEGIDAFDAAVRDLKQGKIIAVKGIGGYRLACLASNNVAVNNLRLVKNRGSKSFAVMFKDSAQITPWARISKKEREVLEGPQRPIVMLKTKKELCPSVAPDSAYTGAMLPSDGLSYMLLRKLPPLVMTSANASGDPLIYGDGEMAAFYEKHSSKIAGVLWYKRDILTPLEDSLVQVVGGKVQILRRARGYAPMPVDLGVKSKKQIFAAGGDLKSSFCFVKENFAYVSQYFGDLENAKANKNYTEGKEHYKNLFGFEPKYFTADKHPQYFSSQAQKNNSTVQHHAAHALSVAAEHHIKGEALAFVFDGTGFGTDGKIWGGEVFTVNQKSVRRYSRIKSATVFGGNRIARDSALAADCYLYTADPDLCGDPAARRVLESETGTFETTSMGRLFDAVAAILGINDYNEYEGKSAIMLEKAASRARGGYPLSMKGGDWRPLLKEIKTLYENGAPVDELALEFHAAVAEYITETAKKYKRKTGNNKIILSGGTFQNRILTELTLKRLKANGFRVYLNEKVPPNDGGIALGQAYLAALRNAEK